jgi:hypothetical protein
MTLAEVRQMSMGELSTWEAYVMENGPLNSMLRLEAAIGRAVSPFIKNARPRDFMPWPKEPEPEATPEKLLLLFKGLASSRKH